MKRVTHDTARRCIVAHAGGPILPGGLVDVVTPDDVNLDDEQRFVDRVEACLIRHGDCRRCGGHLVARAAL